MEKSDESGINNSDWYFASPQKMCLECDLS